jgi:DNA repair exonuclease SbcCD ATPase subunit
VGGNCEHCGQSITEESITQHIEELEAEAALSATEIKNSAAKVAAAKTACDTAQKDLAAENATLQGLYKRAAQYEATKKQALEVKAQIVNDEKSKTITASPTANPYLKRVNEAAKMVTAIRAERTTARAELKAAEKKANLYAYWEKGFGNKGLRSLLLDASIPALNKYAAEYSAMLTDGNIQIEFATQSTLKSGAVAEKFEVKVTNACGGTGYGAASGGEGVKTDLIVGLSLQRLVASKAKQAINIAVYDEAFIYLDGEAMDRVVQLLIHEAKKKSSVFVITNESALKQHFPTEIVVTKQEGISSLK